MSDKSYVEALINNRAKLESRAERVLVDEVRRLREERDLFAAAGKAAEDRIVELREELSIAKGVIRALEENEQSAHDELAKALDAKEAR